MLERLLKSTCNIRFGSQYPVPCRPITVETVLPFPPAAHAAATVGASFPVLQKTREPAGPGVRGGSFCPYVYKYKLPLRTLQTGVYFAACSMSQMASSCTAGSAGIIR